MPDYSMLEQRQYEMAQTLAAIKQGQDDMHNRLFVDGGGILPAMFKKITDMEKDMITKASAEDLKATNKELADFKTKRAYHIGYGAGAGSLIVLGAKYVGSWALQKLGIHV